MSEIDGFKAEIGDTVQLKSGGPVMTVESVEEYSGELEARCVWFAGTERKDGLFKPGMLCRAD